METLLDNFKNCTNHTNHKLELITTETKDMRNLYITVMTKRGQTHPARNYKFRENIDEANVSKNTFIPQEKMNSKQKTLYGLMTTNWLAIKSKIQRTSTVSDFLAVQEEILDDILQKANKTLNIQCAAQVLLPTLKERARNFLHDSCPRTINRVLYDLLSLKQPPENIGEYVQKYDEQYPVAEENHKIDFSKQFKLLGSPDRRLRQQYDYRCEHFRPTCLQRRVMTHLDKKHNVVVKSPASSGKTMVSLYLAHKTKVSETSRRKTIYLGPNKPVCGEFSLFAHNHDFRFAIAYEDFISWRELEEGELMILTPATLLKILLFPNNENTIDQVGSIIIDEVSFIIHKYLPELFMILMIAKERNWQTLVLSATISDQIIDAINSIIPVHTITPNDAVRPSDLLVRTIPTHDKKCTTIPTHKLYSVEALNQHKDELLRMPLTFDDFKVVFKQSSNQERDTYLPKNTYVTAKHMTDFASSVVHPDDSSNPLLSTCVPSSEVEENIPSSKEIYSLIQNLERDNQLPVMIFHDNKKQLSLWHEEITEYLKAEFGEDDDDDNDGKDDRNRSEKEDERVREDVGSRRKPRIYGSMGPEEMTHVFPHRSDHSGAEGKRGYRFGRRGRIAFASKEYQGLKYGVGVHHHDVDKPVREAVESGLRLGFIKVVMCDYSMAMGINMPVRSVVFIGGGEEPFTSEKFTQASGRAGRWGMDVGGSIFFMNCTKSEIETMWKPLPSLSITFPLTTSHVLMLLASQTSYRSNMMDSWINFNLPFFDWNKESVRKNISRSLQVLNRLGLINMGCRITPAGYVSLQLAEEGDSALIAGYFCSQQERLDQHIVNPRDFLTLATLFVKKWRNSMSNKSDPALFDPKESYFNKDLFDIVQVLIDEIKEVYPELDINPYTKISALYAIYPDISRFPSYQTSGLHSYVAHFTQKMRSVLLKWNNQIAESAIQMLTDALPSYGPRNSTKK
eukprot:TRINITY_DN8651_c0_g1_i1.p1 TRINITY_DN8651_c0_g1~~TRINITY_DN8651_c0_g1_i1.p1  ORF type:complete len:963 (+),score=185.78 TRINITY_DN8651_c0_g1_i1:72-2960(+)